ncbi:MAG: hypothetical protein ACC645_22555, partial [Pirellulales bacterium]
ASFVALGGTRAERGAALGTAGSPDVANLGPDLNTADPERNATLSADRLTLLFNSNRPGGAGGHDLYTATRASIFAPFGNATSLGEDLNTASNELAPTLSRDGLTIIFASNRAGGFGGTDLYTATRSDTADPFGNVMNIGSAMNTANVETDPSISADGLALYFTSDRPGGFGGQDIYVATRSNTLEPFGQVVNLGPDINSAATDASPSISADGETVFFHSDRPGGFGGMDLYVGKRLQGSDFSVANAGPEVNSSRNDRGPSVSFDGQTLLFDSDRPGGAGSKDLYEARADTDWYRLALADGQSTTLALTSLGPGDVTLELYDSDSNLRGRGTPATNVNQVINNFMDPTRDGMPEDYFVRVVGDSRQFGLDPGKYSLVVTKDADFDTEPNDEPGLAAQDITATGIVLGAVAPAGSENSASAEVQLPIDRDGSGGFLGNIPRDGNVNGETLAATEARQTANFAAADVDHYRVEVRAGDTVTAGTSLPIEGPGQFVSDVDLALELYDPDGSLVASDASGPLTYRATVTGSYTVRVQAENDTTGEYVLSVDVGRPGDMDLDGDVDLDDTSAFVLALRDAAAYEAIYGLPAHVRGDTDADGDLDFDDIDNFVLTLRSSLSDARQQGNRVEAARAIPRLEAVASGAAEAPKAPGEHASTAAEPGAPYKRSRQQRDLKRRQATDRELAAIWSDDAQWLAHPVRADASRALSLLRRWQMGTKL